MKFAANSVMLMDPRNELEARERLDALAASGLLDSEPDEGLDRLTKLVATVLKVPIALVSMVDKDRQFFTSQCGVGEPWASKRGTPMSYSFCKHVVRSGEPLLITDAREMDLVKESPAVKELDVIAYAGMPITDPNGFVLGSLCAIDHKPRKWSMSDVMVLRSFALQINSEMQLRARARKARKLEEERKAESEKKLENWTSEDLKTPVSAMQLDVDLLERLGPLTKEQRDYLAVLQRNARKMLDQLEDPTAG